MRTPIIWPPRVCPPMDDCVMQAPPDFYFPNSPLSLIDVEMREAFRRELFEKQKGRCFWCKEPMSITERERVTPSGKVKQNDAFATFEHLKRKRDGGADLDADNIVLAHGGCNRKRDSHHRHPRYAHDPYRLATTV